MQLHDVTKDRARVDPLRSQIGRLIEVVGTPRFESEVFRLARNAIDCEHLTAFASSRDAPPRVLFAANTGPLPVAKSVAQKYVTQYWMLDPASSVVATHDRGPGHIAISTVPDDISDSDYRRDCYTSVRLRDRFTVVRCRGHETVRINFYRGARSGRFEAAAIDCIMSSADLLISLLMKHDASAAPESNKLEPRHCHDRLKLLEPSMPAREAEVCAAIMMGLTSEAIALQLGISVNTVLTYRKRAYARLGISCQNELLRLVLV